MTLDCSPPGSSVHGIFQARILEGFAISSSRGSSRPRDWTCVSSIGRRVLYHWTYWALFDPVPCLIWGMTRCRWSILSLKDSHLEQGIDIKIIIRKQCLVACWGSHRKEGWEYSLRGRRRLPVGGEALTSHLMIIASLCTWSSLAMCEFWESKVDISGFQPFIPNLCRNLKKGDVCRGWDEGHFS